MLPSELADLSLGLRAGLVRAGGWAVRAIGERGQATLLVAGDPSVHGLPGDPQAPCDLQVLVATLSLRVQRAASPDRHLVLVV